MTETVQAAPQPGEIHPIGAIAAQNIANAIGAPSKAKEIEKAIADEIQLMSSHFTMAFADIETTYQADVLKIKSEWTFIKNNKLQVGIAAAATLLLGVLLGHFV